MKKLCQVVLVALFAPAAALHGQLVGVEYNTGSFYSISTVDGSLQFIGDTDVNGIASLEYNPQDGYLYGFTTGDAKATNLYRFAISPSLDNVTAEFIGPLGLSTFEGGLAFSPSGAVYAVNGGSTVPALLSIDLTTGDASVIHLFADRHDFNGLGWRSDGMLIGLDATNNALLTIDPATAAVTTLHAVGPTIGTVGGMALGPQTGYFVTAGPQAAIPGSNSLYSFDPFTGDQVFIANYQNQIVGTGLSGITLIPEPATLGLLLLGATAALRRRRTITKIR